MHTYLHSFLLTICYAFNASIDCTLLFTIKCTYCNSECHTFKRTHSDSYDGSIFSSVDISIDDPKSCAYINTYCGAYVLTNEYSFNHSFSCSFHATIQCSI